MNRMIDIDVTSFFESEYKRLSWTIKEQNNNGATNSVQHDSVTETKDIREAIKHHLDHISAAIQGNGDVMEYEFTLSFKESLQDEDKNRFTEIFNEYNTREESS